MAVWRGCLACHWRSRLGFLLSHTLAMPEAEPRTQVSGHGLKAHPRDESLWVFDEVSMDPVSGFESWHNYSAHSSVTVSRIRLVSSGSLVERMFASPVPRVGCNHHDQGT